jgi:hypothetical protein
MLHDYSPAQPLDARRLGVTLVPLRAGLQRVAGPMRAAQARSSVSDRQMPAQPPPSTRGMQKESTTSFPHS